MFTPEQRDRTRAQLLAHAEADNSIVGLAFTGSHATGDGDRWSDTDIVLAVRGEVAEAVRRWTAWIYDEFGARGPQWRTVFGSPQAQSPFAPPDRNTVIGFAWHHALRDQLITLACLRLALPTAYSKGAHLRPMLMELA
ncbi:hypothetical protein R6V09_10615 [Streptomyces sp. W16]|uniref:hypothetical protein n=1 Tax=Streptomyces sp. W16 TaxID=3076631 RepID=UPI00295A8B8E|nr:hypothetical protein [Streptomyces sp. W16]MDV9170584.1 hypothetical protein [Streptomyces sp. W16]